MRVVPCGPGPVSPVTVTVIEQLVPPQPGDANGVVRVRSTSDAVAPAALEHAMTLASGSWQVYVPATFTAELQVIRILFSANADELTIVSPGVVAPLDGAMFETTSECPDGLAIGAARKIVTWLVETIVTFEMPVPAPAPSRL